MALAQVLRCKKLKGPYILRDAARHNLREIQAELGANSHIDPSKTPRNVVLEGAPMAAGVVATATKFLQLVKKPLRRDAVMGLEIVASLPPHLALMK